MTIGYKEMYMITYNNIIDMERMCPLLNEMCAMLLE